HEHAVFRELGDARVAAAVGDEDVALRVPRDVRRTIEDVLLRAGSRRSATATAAGLSAASGFTSAAAFATTTGPAARILDRFRLASEKECDASLSVELHHHRGILVDDPEVVLGIDADLRGKQESVHALADLARELAGAIELEQPRTAVHEWTRRRERHRRVAGAGVDEDVAARIGRHAADFAQIDVVRQCQWIRRVEVHYGRGALSRYRVRRQDGR